VSHILEIALVGLHPPKKNIYAIGGTSQEGEETLDGENTSGERRVINAASSARSQPIALIIHNAGIGG